MAGALVTGPPRRALGMTAMSQTADSDPADPRVVRALEEYLAALEAGRAPGRADFLARHPELAGELAECLDGLEVMHAAAPAVGDDRPPRSATLVGVPLADYRILREVGRGGMGVVYEAEQLSLRRRVALKVLPFAATLDPRQLQRFQNEAQAAAHLHHPNIVPVYAVGCERGVHYYAMQFIDGQTVADLVHQLRRQAGLAGDGNPDHTDSYSPGADTPILHGPAVSSSEDGGSTHPLAPPVTDQSVPDPARFRRVARLGVQAALALEHAHQTGVIHRDVKPANLLIDNHGHLWVTDFGLAQVHGRPGLTASGDLLGTLRYMSPEQASARHGLVDHRSDVYALGATLYELLTLRPAVPGETREEVLRHLLLDEPRPPRRLDPAVPAELETVVLKALAKDPEERYARRRPGRLEPGRGPRPAGGVRHRRPVHPDRRPMREELAEPSGEDSGAARNHVEGRKTTTVGTTAQRDQPGLAPRHSRLAPTKPGRRSPHGFGCGSSAPAAAHQAGSLTPRAS
jgi:serine/threonine protein kinase